MSLRPYQQTAVDAVFQHFDSPDSGHPLIVMPTGTGKSHVISAITQITLQSWPTARVLMLTHVKELIQQNLEKLQRIWPLAPVGVYSAGLRRQDTDAPILFAGIQSVWRRARELADERAPIDLVLIDEAHRVPLTQTGMYRQFLTDLQTLNPYLRVIGLTATPFRYLPATQTHTGGYALLTEGDGRIFTDIVCNQTPDLADLIRQNHLSMLWPIRTGYQISTEGIGTANGDYKDGELDAMLARDEVVDAILEEAIRLATADGRRHWLVFCAGLGQVAAMTDGFRERGITAAAVTGSTPSGERAKIIADFRAGTLQALVNCDVLTTGFDAPNTDCLIIARPTQSPILHVQIMGRGMRPTPDKIEQIEGKRRGCLVLDFAGNTAMHGPIDALSLKKPRPRGADEEIKPPSKTCPKCKTIVAPSVSVCPSCGYFWPLPEKQDDRQKKPKACDAPILAAFAPPPPVTWYDVTRIEYRRHVKEKATMRVVYFSGSLLIANEFVCLEHDGFARRKAEKWWKNHGGAMPVPETVNEGIERSEELVKSLRIAVVHSGKWKEIKAISFKGLNKVIVE